MISSTAKKLQLRFGVLRNNWLAFCIDDIFIDSAKQRSAYILYTQTLKNQCHTTINCYL